MSTLYMTDGLVKRKATPGFSSTIHRATPIRGVSRKWLKGGLGDFGQKTAVMWLQSAYSTNC